MQTAMILLALVERLMSLGAQAERVVAKIKQLRAEGRETLNPDEVTELLAELDVTDAGWAEQLARLRAEAKAA